jgi:hypothetical protein
MAKTLNAFLAGGISLLVSIFPASADTDANQAHVEMDVESVLARVRQAQRPAENMRIEWVSERGAGGVWAGSRSGAIRLTKYEGSAVLSGNRMRMERRQETYYTNDFNEPNLVDEHIQVFNGTVRRDLERRVKGSDGSRMMGSLSFSSLSPLFRQIVFGGGHPPIHNQERLSGYNISSTEANSPGVYILNAVDSYGAGYRLAIDGNRGFNIVKRERFRSDRTIDYEDNFKLKQYSNETWFISEFERTRHDFEPWKIKRNVEERLIVTGAQFGIPTPDEDTFRLRFAKGTNIWDGTFEYEWSKDFRVGSLSEPAYTMETNAVTAILKNDTKVQQLSGPDEVFGSTRERIINSVAGRTDCFIDFDSGKLLSLPGDFHMNTKPEKWFRENGVDGRAETDEGLCGVWTFNTVVIPVSTKRWDTITPAACHRVLEQVKGIYPPIMSAEGKLPATFLFQTWDNRGILQILQVNKDTKTGSIRIRYKLIEQGQRPGQAGAKLETRIRARNRQAQGDCS